VFKRILVPVEDSPISEHAVDVAGQLAKASGSVLYLLHVVEPPPSYANAVALQLPTGELERAAKEHGRELLTKFRQRIPEGVEVHALIRTAERVVAHEIIASAKEHEVDLIVMGTHGRRGLARAFLGSVAERVARFAEVPVMLIRK
jgi:nucleotide-binding universal stress UspA family protein